MGKKMAHYAHKHHNHAKQYFDLFTYIHSLRKVGVSQEVAEIQGKALKHMSEQISNQSQFLLTKADQQETNLRIVQIQTDVKEIRHELVLTRQELKADIALLREEMKLSISKCINSTRLWMFSMMSLMLGVMARGFHWI